MGQEWDSFKSNVDYQRWVTDWATPLIERALYPGAVCLFFGGTRTWHRLACGLEDAGFEVADSLMYLYGAGFPKSFNLSKAIDRAAGAERPVVGTRVLKGNAAVSCTEKGGTYVAGQSLTGVKDVDVTIPATLDAEHWDGWGTALKPSWEPVILCRAPRGKHRYIDLALEYGTGALWIDGCRIAGPAWSTSGEGDVPSGKTGIYGRRERIAQAMDAGGRWPANLLFSHSGGCARVGEVWECEAGCPVAALDEQSGTSSSKQQRGWRSGERTTGYFLGAQEDVVRGYNDSGGASRFFYTAKASRRERDAGLPEGTKNTHPTVKSLKITEYLARLVLPPVLEESRRILVPFAGTGSEMVGAVLAGWDVVEGIELSDQWIEIGRLRLEHWATKVVQGRLL